MAKKNKDQVYASMDSKKTCRPSSGDQIRRVPKMREGSDHPYKQQLKGMLMKVVVFKPLINEIQFLVYF